MAGLVMLAALLGAPNAAADPEDLQPYCTAGQVPETGGCLIQPERDYTDDAPGAGPEIPMGLNPLTVPAV
jgi:hypothetical protein